MSTAQPSASDLDVWGEPPAGLRWLSMALVCPDCGRKPLDPVYMEDEGLWGLVWPHPDNCPSRYMGGNLYMPDLHDIRKQEVAA